MNCKTDEKYCHIKNNFDFDYLMEKIEKPAHDDMKCRMHMEKCDFDTWAVAMTYVPMQPWEEPYDPETGLAAGTIFSSLDLPFLGGGYR